MGWFGGGGGFIEENNRKNSISVVIVPCSHIYGLHLVEHIRLCRLHNSYEIGEQVHEVVS